MQKSKRTAAVRCVALILLLATEFLLAINQARSQAPGVLPQPGFVSPKIVGVGARTASSAQYGSVVAVSYDMADGKRYICTGTLLTTKLILTAGHCGCGLTGTYGVSINQDARVSDVRQLLQVDGNPIVFDQRVCRTGNLDGGNDLALIRLANDIDLNRSDQPPQASDLSAGYGYPSDKVIDLRTTLVKGTKLTAVGYGYTSSSVIGMRMQAEIPIFSFDCEERNLNSFCAPFAEMILAEAAGSRARNDTCGGDSGGPVFRFLNGLPRLIGVTSRAAPGMQDNPNLHCGGGGIYTLIGRNTVKQWLRANGVPEQR